mmetsp:Transcript_16564/g.49456  ORF Transcript_16564/g.49456 Transcript_16564/m.49456 type:complete len:219 (-) Transcript_16564:513-1169(-)
MLLVRSNKNRPGVNRETKLNAAKDSAAVARGDQLRADVPGETAGRVVADAHRLSMICSPAEALGDHVCGLGNHSDGRQGHGLQELAGAHPFALVPDGVSDRLEGVRGIPESETRAHARALEPGEEVGVGVHKNYRVLAIKSCFSTDPAQGLERTLQEPRLRNNTSCYIGPGDPHAPLQVQRNSPRNRCRQLAPRIAQPEHAEHRVEHLLTFWAGLHWA